LNSRGFHPRQWIAALFYYSPKGFGLSFVLCNPVGVVNKTGYFIPRVAPVAIQLKAFQAFKVDNNAHLRGHNPFIFCIKWHLFLIFCSFILAKKVVLKMVKNMIVTLSVDPLPPLSRYLKY
jgi:hypothetical protein